MTICLHKTFKKNYQKRIAPNTSLVKRFEERLALFLENPFHPVLQNHQLIGEKLSLRAFSVTGSIRIVYAPLSNRKALFLDIGTHNQVY